MYGETARPGEDGYQDGYQETKAKLDSLARRSVAPVRALKTCSACGRETSHLMNASLRAGVCADCYERYSD